METENRTADVPQLPIAAGGALRAGNKIEAIKIVREEQNIGLKETKDTVEAYLRSQPELQAAYASTRSESNRNGLVGFAALIILALLAWYFLRMR